MSNDLAVVENVNGTSLEVYRDRTEVRELANRLLSLHPAAAEVGQPGMYAIAQLALMIGASPLPGVNEIHVWKSGNKTQFQLGINYFRRMAQEEGGVLWQTQPRQMRDPERQEYGVQQGQLAAICRGVRVADMEKFLKLGFAANQIFDMLAATGISVAGQNEGKHGRPAVWTALKRCEVDLYKQLFPTLMQKVSRAQMDVPDVAVETDAPDWGEPDEFDRHNADADKSIEELSAELFSTAPDPTVDAEYEEVEPEAEQPEEAAPEPTQEPEEAADPELESIIADCRAWLEDKIKDGQTELGFVMDAAAMTPLYNSWKHAHNALAGEDGYDFPEGFKVTRKQTIYGKPALAVYDWLVERKVDTAEPEPAE